MGPPQEEEQNEQDEKDRAGAHVNGNTAATIPREVKTTTRTQTHTHHCVSQQTQSNALA